MALPAEFKAVDLTGTVLANLSQDLIPLVQFYFRQGHPAPRLQKNLSKIRYRIKIPNPGSIAVCPITGNFFVTASSDRPSIKAFDSKGNYLFQFGEAQDDDPSLPFVPSGVCLDPTRNYNVVVADVYRRVLTYSSKGEYLTEFSVRNAGLLDGVTVHPFSGTYLIPAKSYGIKEYSYDGLLIREFGSELQYPCDMQVDGYGNFWVGCQDSVCLLSPDGTLLQNWPLGLNESISVSLTVDADGTAVTSEYLGTEEGGLWSCRILIRCPTSERREELCFLETDNFCPKLGLAIDLEGNLLMAGTELNGEEIVACVGGSRVDDK